VPAARAPAVAVGRPAVNRLGKILAGAGVLVALGAAGLAATGFGLPSRAHKGGQSSNGKPPATATVTRQTLIDAESHDGELGYGDSTTMKLRAAGTVTWLPGAGTTVERGQAAYRIDDLPVILLYGSLPVWRALSVGTEGADVKQFEQNLKALGYTGFTVDDTYNADTARAVKKWQKKLGLTETGTVELGRVDYTAGPVRVGELKVAVGDTMMPGSGILAYTGTRRVVTVELDVSDQRLAVKAAAVTVTLPDGKAVGGRITDSQAVIVPAQGDTAATTKISVLVGLDDEKPVAGLDQATVSVGFTASKRENVLTVPVNALLALSEGGYGVQVVTGAGTRVVAVQLGLFASGRVEISGDAIAEGDTVGVPS
jgi:membrane fusion protein, multidrug efflux system